MSLRWCRLMAEERDGPTGRIDTQEYVHRDVSFASKQICSTTTGMPNAHPPGWSSFRNTTELTRCQEIGSLSIYPSLQRAEGPSLFKVQGLASEKKGGPPPFWADGARKSIF